MLFVPLHGGSSVLLGVILKDPRRVSFSASLWITYLMDFSFNNCFDLKSS